MKRNDVIVCAYQYLETFPFVIFAIAELREFQTTHRETVREQLEKWRATGRIPKHTEDFCIDLLAGRIGVDTILDEKGVEKQRGKKKKV